MVIGYIIGDWNTDHSLTLLLPLTLCVHTN